MGRHPEEREGKRAACKTRRVHHAKLSAPREPLVAGSAANCYPTYGLEALGSGSTCSGGRYIDGNTILCRVGARYLRDVSSCSRVISRECPSWVRHGNVTHVAFPVGPLSRSDPRAQTGLLQSPIRDRSVRHERDEQGTALRSPIHWGRGYRAGRRRRAQRERPAEQILRDTHLHKPRPEGVAL
eukprot:2514639-Prymnesium_polylepis.2